LRPPDIGQLSPLKVSGNLNEVVCAPNSQAHFMIACDALVNANMCVSLSRHRVSTLHGHFFSAPAYRHFGATGFRQPFEFGHNAGFWVIVATGADQ